jgi:hypothetical protein
VPDDLGNYGRIGISSPTNLPPARFGHVSWVDSLGNFWIFSGRDGNINLAFNDLWEFVPDTSCRPANPVQSFQIQAAKTITCPGDSIQICAPTGFSGYYWNTGDTSGCINAAAPGKYNLSAMANGICQVSSNQLSIYTYPPQSISVTQNSDTLVVYNGVEYQWYLSGSPIPGAVDSVYIAAMPGTYTVQITDSNGCNTLSNSFVITGFGKDLSGSSIAVFPNPTTTSWQLNVDARWIGSRLSVFDATGRLVYRSLINSLHSLLEIPGVANGVYTLQMVTGNYSIVKMLVKD